MPSMAHSLYGLEQSVMSGLPFWEESEFIETDSYLDNNDPYDEEKQFSNQSDAVDSPTRNVLAERIINKIAIEKKNKIYLMNDLDQIKSRFTAIKRNMTR